MKNRIILALTMLVGFAVLASGQQASLTLKDCGSELCSTTYTDWSLRKCEPQPNGDCISGEGTSLPAPVTVRWRVTATKGATSSNTLSIYGFLSITNSGSLPATLGNIVVNLQRKNGPKNQWKTVVSNVANSSAGDAATSASICKGASSEDLSSFSEGSGSGSLEFTNAGSNSLFSLGPSSAIAPGATVNLLYVANFNNSILGIPAGEQVRSEVIVTFGNSGSRGGSGATCNNVDANGNGAIGPDEANVRSVVCRVTSSAPAIEDPNSTVTLTDKLPTVFNGDPIEIGEDVVFGVVYGIVTIGNVSFSNFTTDIGGGTGQEDLTGSSGDKSVSVDVAEGSSGAIANCANLRGRDHSVTINGPVDPLTGLPVTYSMPCATGLNITKCAWPAINTVQCQDCNYCSYTQGGYQGRGVPGQLFDNSFIAVFPSGLTIGVNDGVGPLHHALWTADAAGRTALKTYLGGGGPSGALSADTTNATSTSGGTLAKQAATLTLNVAFSDAGLTTPGYGNRQLCGFTATPSLNGMRVRDVLAAANQALGGNGFPLWAPNPASLNNLLTELNEAYDDCEASLFAAQHLVAVCTQ
jgi:hypothetical protein